MEMIFDQDRKISRTLTDRDCNDRGKCRLPKRSVEEHIIRYMDDNLKSKISDGESHEVALHNLNDISIRIVQFKLHRNKYVLTDFYPIVQSYGLKTGDTVEFSPVYGLVGNQLTMSITFKKL